MNEFSVQMNLFVANRYSIYSEIGSLELELESFYSITTFIGDMSQPLQIRQVAHRMEHHMQPARIKPHAEGAHKQPRPET